ncbi:MAG: hypothetical protein IAI48_18110 [Candidatus Eremiobacteraeota bacterium]|nr:hypothetical protein [Candidatus Eremiobacteraeota bacterium]
MADRLFEPRVARAALVYLAVAAIVSTQLGTWTDEEYTLATTAHGPVYAFGRALTYELQAPLYFVLEAIWREANASIWWARLPSILCTALSFGVFARIGRRIAPERDPLPFVLIAGLNPFVVYAGFEIRLYAFALLAAGVMWLLFDAGFVSGASTRARILLVVTSVLAIYTQYFLAFALVGFGCALLAMRRWKALGAFVAICVPIGLAALPLAIRAHHQVGGYVTVAPPLGALLRQAALHPWTEFIFPWDSDWDEVRGVRLAYDVVVVIGFGVIIAAMPRLRRSDLGWIACAVSIEATYLALLAAVRLELNSRHYVALYVPVAAATYAVACGILRGSRPRYALVFGLSAALVVAGTVTRYRALAQPGDWRRVAAYVRAEARPGDAIVVYAADSVAPFERQYHGDLPVVPFPVAPDTDVYSDDVLTLRSESQAKRAFDALAGYRHLWFVDDIGCFKNDKPYGCAYVQPAIDRQFDVLRSRAFFENSVRELSTLRSEGREHATHP